MITRAGAGPGGARGEPGERAPAARQRRVVVQHPHQPPSPLWRPKRAIDSVYFALHGILHAFRSQRHLRVHFYVGVLVLLAGVVWRWNASSCSFSSSRLRWLSSPSS